MPELKLSLTQRHSPLVSTDLGDLVTPGVMVEMDAGEAQDLGAFEETALSLEDAWDANDDVGAA